MWVDLSTEGVIDDLRQGDILGDVALLKPARLPLDITRPAGAEPARGHTAPVAVEVGDFMVLSQCCIIEQDKKIVVAPIRKLSKQTDEDIAIYFADHTADRYAVRAHGLMPVGERFSSTVDGELWVADLTSQVTVTPPKPLVDHFIARMTVPARRDLRLRLAAFWSRAEPEDEKLLQQQLPPAG